MEYYFQDIRKDDHIGKEHFFHT